LAPTAPFEDGDLLIVISVERGTLHPCHNLLGRTEMRIFLAKKVLQKRENV